MKNKDLFRRIAAAVFAAVLVCLIAWSGSTDAADSVVSDAFYQHESAGGEDIVIVEIDERAMQELGPWPWSRSVMAEVIRTLNSAEDGSRPAAIAHLCRTVCRRAERRILTLATSEEIQPEILSYTNRLSDYFYVLALRLNFLSKTEEILWHK